MIHFDGGRFAAIVNGYFPAVSLLLLIMILPIMFEWIAVNFEDKKTKSSIQRSILGRYFYYQVRIT